MKNFILFFEEKEGTSPLVRLLNNFAQISIIHQVNNYGWEPFDRHNCGPMSLSNLERCLDLVFNKESTDFEQLNQIYLRSAKRPLEEVSRNGVVGFKMRFTPPTYLGAFSRLSRLSSLVATPHTHSFKHIMIKLLQRNNIVVLLAVRQDLLRWGLSKYHGDGTGKSGHLQFKLANGTISEDEIGKIHVDCNRLEKIIAACEQLHAHKRRLIEEFKQANIQVYPLCYENFLTDKPTYMSQLFTFLDLNISKEELAEVLNNQPYFKKVHSDSISDFVENHEEVTEKFDNRFISWC